MNIIMLISGLPVRDLDRDHFFLNFARTFIDQNSAYLKNIDYLPVISMTGVPDSIASGES
jgi:hypothetical protein